MSEFHIHADLQEPAPKFEEFLRSVGAYEDPFLAREGVITHEPRYHYTCKFQDPREFKQVWQQIKQYLEDHRPQWHGYLETEALYGGNIVIADRPFDPTIPLPFTINHKNLQPGQFRRNELHIYFNDAQTDSRIKDAMAKIGFFPAWCNSPQGVEGIWTVQATTIPEIEAIRPTIMEFLLKAGGTVGCNIDEERVVDFALSGPDVKLAPVIGTINWL